MEICNRENEVIAEGSDNMWAYYMTEAYGLQYSRSWDDDYLMLYTALATTSLSRQSDDQWTERAVEYEEYVDILSYPTEDPSEIEYPE